MSDQQPWGRVGDDGTVYVRVGESGLGLGGLLLGEVLDRAAQRADAGLEGGEVADGVRLRDRRGEGLHAAGDVRRRSAALGALLEQGDLPGELGVLALKVGESLFCGAVGVLSYRALALGFANENSTGLVDAAPGSLIV